MESDRHCRWVRLKEKWKKWHCPLRHNVERESDLYMHLQNTGEPELRRKNRTGSDYVRELIWLGCLERLDLSKMKLSRREYQVEAQELPKCDSWTVHRMKEIQIRKVMLILLETSRRVFFTKLGLGFVNISFFCQRSTLRSERRKEVSFTWWM